MEPVFSDVRSCVCLDARRVARNLTRVYDRALRPSGLKVTQFQLLAAIGEAEPVTQQRLAELMGMDRTTLTRNLALLEGDSLLKIDTGSTDRREHFHRLTAAGRKAVARAMPMWRRVHRKLLQQLADGQASATPEQLRSVLSGLATFKG